MLVAGEHIELAKSWPKVGSLQAAPSLHLPPHRAESPPGGRAPPQCLRASPLPGETLAQCQRDPAPFGTNNLLSQVKVNEDKGSLQPQTHSWHITVLGVKEHRAGDASSPWLLVQQGSSGPCTEHGAFTRGAGEARPA